MTVQQLIDELMKIEDKTLEVKKLDTETDEQLSIRTVTIQIDDWDIHLKVIELN